MSYPQGGGYPPPGSYQPGGGFPPPQQYGGYGAPPPAQYADIGKRIFAAIIDGLLGGLAALPGIILIVIGGVTAASQADSRSGRLSDEAAGAFVGLVLLGYALIFLGAFGFALYNIYLLGRDGATLGKRWMKIKVLDPQGQPLGFGKAFLRELIKGALGNVCFILLLWPLWDQEKQGLWDKVFQTHTYNA